MVWMFRNLNNLIKEFYWVNLKFKSKFEDLIEISLLNERDQRFYAFAYCLIYSSLIVVDLYLWKQLFYCKFIFDFNYNSNEITIFSRFT